MYSQRWVGLIAAMVVGGCTSGSVATPPESTVDTVPAATSEVFSADVSRQGAVELQAERRLGFGWAIAAAPVEDGTVVATTVGVRRVPADGADGSVEEAVESVLDGDIRDVRASQDGRFIALLSGSGAAEVIDMATLAPLIFIDQAEDVNFRSDATIVTSHPTAIRHVSLPDGATLTEFVAPAGRTIVGTAVDDSTVVAAIAGEDGTELVWWQGSGSINLIPLDLAEGVEVEQLALTTDDHHVAVGTFDRWGDDGGEIGVIDLASGAPVWKVPSEFAAIESAWLTVNEGGLVVVESSSFQTYDRAGKITSTGELPGAVDEIASIGTGWAAAAVNGRLAVVSSGGDVKVVPGAHGLVRDFEPAPNGLIVVDVHGRVERLTDGGDVQLIADQFVAAPVNDVAVSQSGALATASSNGFVHVVPTVAEPQRLDHPEGNVDAVVFAADGDQVVTGIAQRRAATSFDDTVVFWELEQPQPTRRATLRGQVEPVDLCSFFDSIVRIAPDGSFVAASSHDFTVSLFAAEDATEQHVFAPHGGGIYDIAISSDSERLATSADDSRLRLFNLQTFELEAEYELETSILAMAFLPDGRLVASDILGDIFIFDTASGTRTDSFEGTKLRSSRLAVSPDGSLLAAGGEGAVVQVWAIESGRIKAVGSGHAAPVTSVAFDTSGSRLLSGSQDGTAILWVIETL